jgi:hypothetical protein
MIIANKTTGNVNLIHGANKDIQTVKFSPWGTRDSVQVLEGDVWGNSRNLQRYLSRGLLTELKSLVEFPDPPDAYQTLAKWQKSRVRAVVLGTDAEFEATGLIVPMGSNPNTPASPDRRYIRSTLIPTLEVAEAWLGDLFQVSGDKSYKDRKKRLSDHIAELREILANGA